VRNFARLEATTADGMGGKWGDGNNNAVAPELSVFPHVQGSQIIMHIITVMKQTEIPTAFHLSRTHIFATCGWIPHAVHMHLLFYTLTPLKWPIYIYI
jgi:hypothetical protein